MKLFISIAHIYYTPNDKANHIKAKKITEERYSSVEKLVN